MAPNPEGLPVVLGAGVTVAAAAAAVDDAADILLHARAHALNRVVVLGQSLQACAQASTSPGKTQIK